MSTPLLKIKVTPKPTIKGKMDVRFPANVAVQNFLTVTKSNGTYTFGVDYTLLDPSPVVSPNTSYLAVYDAASTSYKIASLASIVSGSQTTQVITVAGAVTVQPLDGLIVLNKTVGAATTVNLPAAAAKIGPVKIVDWKGDAGTNNITIVPNGTEKIQGLSQWVIGADNASLVLTPVTSGVTGYAV